MHGNDPQPTATHSRSSNWAHKKQASKTKINDQQNQTSTSTTMNSSVATTTTDTCTEQSTQTKIQKKVHFGDYVEFTTIPEDDLTSASWCDLLEIKESFRADVIAFLTEYRRNQEMREMGLEDGDEDTEHPEPVCARGLESYFPGQQALRNKLRTMYALNVLLKSKEVNYFYGLEEASDRLGMFASALGENSQRKAHALALQDALDARFIHEEEEGRYVASTNSKDGISSLDFIPLIRHEFTTPQTTSKARAAWTKNRMPIWKIYSTYTSNNLERP